MTRVSEAGIGATVSVGPVTKLRYLNPETHRLTPAPQTFCDQGAEAHHWVNYSTAWRSRIEPRFGTAPVRRIKRSHIDDWIAHIIPDGVSPTKVIEAVGVLRRVLDRAVRDKAIAQNSCTMRSGSLPKRPQTERPVLSPPRSKPWPVR